MSVEDELSGDETSIPQSAATDGEQESDVGGPNFGGDGEGCGGDSSSRRVKVV